MSGASEALAAVLKGRRVVLVRHGNTAKAEVDADRELTDVGRSQCAKFKEAWSGNLMGVSTVLASYVTRTMQTATLVAEGLGPSVTPVEDLYFVRPWRTDAMRDADRDCGYAPVSTYIERHPGSHDAAAEAMGGAVAAALAAAPPGDVMVVGHAGYLSFLALEVVEAFAIAGASEDAAWREAARKVVLDANVGEACGFEIGAAGARYLPNPESTDFAAAKSNDAFVTGSSS